MSSQAWQAFRANTADIERLLALHEQQGGVQPGRRFGLEVLNKSAIVLITSFWEAYCEDIAAEGLNHIVEKASIADQLPIDLRKLIAKELKGDAHDLRVWDLAGDGWRDVLRSRLEILREGRNRKLNTPKTQNINELFASALGIQEIATAWHWPKKMTASRASQKLDKYVTLRGEIAHRGSASKSVTKAQVKDYYKFILKVGSRTGGQVNSQVKRITGTALWT